MGCQLMVHTEFLLRAELPRLAEHRPSVSLSARLCFRNSLCSSLESLYFLPPREHQALNGHTNEATFLLCIMVFTRNCGRRKTKMKLITLASSLPLLSSLFPLQVQSSCRLFNQFYLITGSIRVHTTAVDLNQETGAFFIFFSSPSYTTLLILSVQTRAPANQLSTAISLTLALRVSLSQPASVLLLHLNQPSLATAPSPPNLIWRMCRGIGNLIHLGSLTGRELL